MDPPSSNDGGGGGGGDGPSASSTAPRNTSINQVAFCHECGIEIRPLMAPDPTCPRCNGQFVEIIEGGSLGAGEDDDDDEINNPFAPVGGDPFPGFTFRTGTTQGGGLPQTLNSLLMAMAGAAPNSAGAGSMDTNAQGSSNQQSNRSATGGEDQDADRDRRASSSSTNRSGSTSFGPFGLRWNVQYGSGAGDFYQEHYRREQQNEQQRQQQQEFQSPPTLSNFLRFAFGGAESTDETPQQQEDTYFHDDGMGGAGGVADGRHFNHDNRGTYHQPPQSPNDPTSGRASNNTNPRAAQNDLPPELGALRNLFTGLFGERGATQGGSLLDILAAGAHGAGGGPRGQWGDYVLGQQGLDDIISQLMEQTQGSTAPPPATEDAIDKLERFTRKDSERVDRAKNQDCPTCKDEFLPATAEAKEEVKKEEREEEEQQEELISMPCGHIFHEDCLVPWLRMHGTCPVCRISIVKAREGEEASPGGSGAQQSQASQSGTAPRGTEPVPGGWPSPPNPFASLFSSNVANRPPGGAGVQVPRDSPAATTTTYHPLPPTSTTVTSTVYPTPAVAPEGSAVEVVNSIVSSPPIVSDREEYFSEEYEESREEMRDRARRAAEARTARNHAQPVLEPDELD